MINKKAFTLVELLATIAIISVVSLIGYFSYTSISSSMKKRSYDNLLIKIAESAKDYQEDTGLKQVYVKTLIEEGYLSDNNGDIINPVSKESMLCYYYDSNSDKVVESSSCDKTFYENVGINFTYCISSTSSCSSYSSFDPNKWYKGTNFSLKANYVGPSSETEVESYWVTPLEPDEKIEGKVVKLNVENGSYLMRNYKFILKTNARTYVSYASINIDNDKPVVSDIKVTPEGWNKNKVISANYYDNGSGVKYYALTKNTTTVNEWIDINNNTNKSCVIDNNSISCSVIDNGTYYIWIKDGVGNINDNTGASIKVEKIDITEPTCQITNKSNNNKTSGISFTVSCSDTESGVASCAGSTASSSSKSGIKSNQTYKVVDKAGNEGYCSINVSSCNCNPHSVNCTTTYKSCRDSSCPMENYTYSDVCNETWRGLPVEGCESLNSSKYFDCYQEGNNRCSCSYNCQKTGTRHSSCRAAGCGVQSTSCDTAYDTCYSYDSCSGSSSSGGGSTCSASATYNNGKVVANGSCTIKSSSCSCFETTISSDKKTTYFMNYGEECITTTMSKCTVNFSDGSSDTRDYRLGVVENVDTCASSATYGPGSVTANNGCSIAKAECDCFEANIVNNKVLFINKGTGTCQTSNLSYCTVTFSDSSSDRRTYKKAPIYEN